MSIAKKLLDWYKKNARVLPWRSDPQPYKVWVSEIMLQQTQVDTVIPYFLRWMEKFPDLFSLASATEGDVLQAWEGLGYYSRARNLHKAARIVSKDYGGKLPDVTEELLKLPGIGRYTAGAIASIAYGKDSPALDGNIRRVYARLFNVKAPLSSKDSEKLLWKIAACELPSGNAGDYNQALMDLGSSICTPSNPLCMLCPLSEECQAYALGLQAELPVKKIKPQTPHYLVTAAVIKQDELVLIAKRPANGLLGGLWEFPGGKKNDTDPDLESCLQREIREELDAEIHIDHALGIYRHAYTHFKITLHAFACHLAGSNQPQAIQPDEIRWVRLDELTDYPMGKVDRLIADEIILQGADGAH